MELKLQKLIENIESMANVQNLDAHNSIVVRLSNTISAKINVIACSISEPIQMVLPLNVSWMCFDPQSSNYRKILVRQSKVADAVAGYANTWRAANAYTDVFIDQYYDANDTAYLNEASVIRDATTTRSGIVRLSVDPLPLQPSKAVSEGDPRLSDSREPLPHTHPTLPAESLKTTANPVVISTSTPPQAGFVLVATGDTSAVWRKLQQSDILA